MRIDLSAPKNIDLVASLFYGNTQLDKMLTFVQRNKDSIEVLVKFPENADYTLNIYAKDETEKNYQMVISYIVSVKKGENTLVGFPEIYDKFNLEETYLYYPRNRFLLPNTRVPFKISSKYSEEIAIIYDDNIYAIFVKEGNVFKKEILVPKGDFYLASRLKDSNYYNYLVKFSGWKQSK